MQILLSARLVEPLVVATSVTHGRRLRPGIRAARAPGVSAEEDDHVTWMKIPATS